MSLDRAIAIAVDVLRRGGVVAYPTDTLYGLAVDPGRHDAVVRLFAVKGRPAGQAVPLIAADESAVANVGVMTPLARALARTFWPGPLSLIVDARIALADGIAATDGTIAIRVPAHDVSRRLAAQFGSPITATSANISGQPPSASAAHISKELGDRIDLVLDAGDAPGGLPSTIVDARGRVPHLVRAGAVPWERVLESVE